MVVEMQLWSKHARCGVPTLSSGEITTTNSYFRLGLLIRDNVFEGEIITIGPHVGTKDVQGVR